MVTVYDGESMKLGIPFTKAPHHNQYESPKDLRHAAASLQLGTARYRMGQQWIYEAIEDEGEEWEMAVLEEGRMLISDESVEHTEQQRPLHARERRACCRALRRCSSGDLS